MEIIAGGFCVAWFWARFFIRTSQNMLRVIWYNSMWYLDEFKICVAQTGFNWTDFECTLIIEDLSIDIQYQRCSQWFDNNMISLICGLEYSILTCRRCVCNKGPIYIWIVNCIYCNIRSRQICTDILSLTFYQLACMLEIVHLCRIQNIIRHQTVPHCSNWTDDLDHSVSV